MPNPGSAQVCNPLKNKYLATWHIVCITNKWIGTLKTIKERVKMKNVLVVEDHPDMLEILTWQMEILRFSVITAKNGREGVERAFEEKPQLILMDIMMPGMDGREATRMIRANSETQEIPILAATALFRGSDIRSCFEAGCNDYISKPFTFQELQRKIQEFVPDTYVPI